MRVSLFDYDLPPKLIAQHPPQRRRASRMLILQRDSGHLTDGSFADLPEYLTAGDCLVINDTKVIPARLLGRRATGGRVELLLLQPAGDGCWRALARPARRLQMGEEIDFGGEIIATITKELPAGERLVRLEYQGDLHEVLDRVGRTPLPPYIERQQKPLEESLAEDLALEQRDRARYQTVYAQKPGAVAAPTAGLHFDEAMLERLTARGVKIAPITLHVSLGTFRPVSDERVEDHQMDGESYTVSADTAQVINACRSADGRIVAVGTTVVRTLETVADESGQIYPASGSTELFIYSGYQFRTVDVLLTNFHLPSSTLLMLVSAFAGRQPVLRAYQKAIEREYRFYSYGDCMLIL